MASIIKAVKTINPHIKVAYHTDGCNYDIIPGLIEIGLDVLNPIQTECMSPEVLQEKYGDKLCFFGGIAVQSTLVGGAAGTNTTVNGTTNITKAGTGTTYKVQCFMDSNTGLVDYITITANP